jgi:fluoroacetyl-CoA thioesterase
MKKGSHQRKTKRGARRPKATAKTPRRGAQAKPSENVSTPHNLPRLGLEATLERVVEHENTIQAINRALPAVLSTPEMIGMMEHASVPAIQSELPAGTISVGTRIEVDHLKAVPPGATVRAWARLVQYQGRFMIFEVEAKSGEHVIGRGRVFRAIVEPAKHGEKAKTRVEE